MSGPLWGRLAIDYTRTDDWFAPRRDNEQFFVPFLEQGITTQVTGNWGACRFGYNKDTKYRDLVGSGVMDIAKITEDTSIGRKYRYGVSTFYRIQVVCPFLRRTLGRMMLP